MTLQVLKYFVSVAYYRNYTRAAKECYITQPALSRAIAALEQELDCRLFDRNTKQVTLTQAGEVCLRDAQEILAKCEQLRFHVKGTARPHYHLNVGYMYAGYLPYLSRRLMELEGRFQIDTEYGTLAELKRKLFERKLDIMLAPTVNCDGVPGIRYAYVDRSRLCALLRASDPLAEQEVISIHDLSRRSFIAWDEEVLPGVSQTYSNICQENGFRPNYVATGKKVGDVLMQMCRYDAVALTSESIGETLPRDFKVVPLQQSREQYGVVCAWLEDNRTPVIMELERLLQGADEAGGNLLPEVISE